MTRVGTVRVGSTDARRLSNRVWFDFFLVPPHHTFTIDNRDDVEATVLLVIISVAVTEVALWGRRQQARASRRSGYLEGVLNAARTVAEGDASTSTVTDLVAAQITDAALDSGEVTHWRNLAHRTHADLEATGMQLRLDTVATDIDVAGRRLAVRSPDGSTDLVGYDELVVGTGALPVRLPIDGLDEVVTADGVHVLHSMGDTFALTDSLGEIQPRTALIVGAGDVGLEMAEGLTGRGIQVVQVEMLPGVPARC